MRGLLTVRSIQRARSKTRRVEELREATARNGSTRRRARSWSRRPRTARRTCPSAEAPRVVSGARGRVSPRAARAPPIASPARVATRIPPRQRRSPTHPPPRFLSRTFRSRHPQTRAPAPRSSLSARRGSRRVRARPSKRLYRLYRLYRRYRGPLSSDASSSPRARRAAGAHSPPSRPPPPRASRVFARPTSYATPPSPRSPACPARSRARCTPRRSP
mmetsp:Transcript_9724/g.41323  ORF Transcript_9724/g.41323 Transcript_9724/m.41323 type:complete len:218 (+) Transcript_9724:2131-2784(+)